VTAKQQVVIFQEISPRKGQMAMEERLCEKEDFKRVLSILDNVAAHKTVTRMRYFTTEYKGEES